MTTKTHEYRLRLTPEAQQALIARQIAAQKATNVKIGLPTLLSALIEKTLLGDE